MRLRIKFSTDISIMLLHTVLIWDYLIAYLLNYKKLCDKNNELSN